MANTGDNIYRRKDKRWEGRFISGRKANGQAKYTYVYGKTRTETKEKLEKRKLMVAAQPTGSCRMTVKELFLWYLERIDVKPSTRSRYKFQIENHILPHLGSVSVASLTANQLLGFLHQQRESGRLDGGGLSVKSVRDIGVLIKAALKAAVTEYHFYCDALNVKLPKAKQREIEPFTGTELQIIAKMLTPAANYKDAGIILSANCGARLGEVCAAKVSDIDFVNGTFRIERAVQRIKQGEKTQLVVQTPKSDASVRTVPLPADALEYLQKAVAGLPQDAYILTGRADKPMEPRTYQYYFESVLRRCGIRKRCYHTLRHPYVKHTTKIFSLRLMNFQAQAYPDARRKTRGACQLHRGGQSQSPVRPLCNRKRFSCLPPQSKMSRILYAISMRLSGYTSTRSISSSASSAVSVSASKIALDASLRLSCRACSSCFCFACANTAA